jgi:uncharacterized protein
MSKIILTLVLVFAVLLVLRLLNPRKPQAPKRKPAPDKQKDLGSPERMLACAHCGALVPHSQAVLAQGKTYCSSEHAGRSH